MPTLRVHRRSTNDLRWDLCFEPGQIINLLERPRAGANEPKSPPWTIHDHGRARGAVMFDQPPQTAAFGLITDHPDLEFTIHVDHGTRAEVIHRGGPRLMRSDDGGFGRPVIVCAGESLRIEVVSHARETHRATVHMRLGLSEL